MVIVLGTSAKTGDTKRAPWGPSAAMVRQCNAMNGSAEHSVHFDKVKLGLTARGSLEMVTTFDSGQRTIVGVLIISTEVWRRN